MYRFSLLPDTLALVRLPADAPIPGWALESSVLCSLTRTGDELSVVCPEAQIPPGLAAEPGWRGLKLHGPFPFTQIGVLASVASPLAREGVSIFAISTFDTDYILVKASQLDRALEALGVAGHVLVP